MYEDYAGELIDNLIEEKVMYAELRPMLLGKSIPSDDGQKRISISDQMSMHVAGVERKQEELQQKNMLHKFPFGLKIIYCTPRSIKKKTMREELKQCLQLRKEFPDQVIGMIDLN